MPLNHILPCVKSQNKEYFFQKKRIGVQPFVRFSCLAQKHDLVRRILTALFIVFVSVASAQTRKVHIGPRPDSLQTLFSAYRQGLLQPARHLKDGLSSQSLFLKGDKVEIGVHPAGSFGSDINTPIPEGYHPQWTFWSNPGLSDLILGFNCDVNGDGYDVGTPPFVGDYFVPGAPLEGWGFEWNIGADERWALNFGAIGDYASSFWQIPPEQFYLEESPEGYKVVWESTAELGEEKLFIRQIVRYNRSDTYFTIEVMLQNVGTVTLESVEYFRNVDPDMELHHTGYNPLNYYTRNYVKQQPGWGSNTDTAIVVAHGRVYGYPLILGTVHPDAVVSVEGNLQPGSEEIILDPDDILDSPEEPLEADNLIEDAQLLLAYRFGDMVPGACSHFVFFYNLEDPEKNTIVYPIEPDFFTEPDSTDYAVFFTENSTGDGAVSVINVFWDIDNDGLTDGTGSRFRGVFPAPGLYPVEIKVQLCDGSLDSAMKMVRVLSPSLLGGMQTACVGDTLVLDAGDFPGYLWDNGETDRYREVYLPGKYWVEVQTLSGSTIRDTVAVSFFPFSGGEANVWYFGIEAGLSFNQNAVNELLDGKVNTVEGVASISDFDGNLLFYTDGMSIWDRTHALMPEGQNLLGDWDATQSAVIVRQPGSHDFFYVFTVDKRAEDNGVRYSIVDMRLNNGLGDVIPGAKNTLLFAPSPEKITAVRHANNLDIWVIGHEWGGNRFYAYLIDSEGLVSDPVVSAIGSPHQYEPLFGNENSNGYMKASPDGRRLAVTMPIKSEVEVFDFDHSNGRLSKPVSVDVPGRTYGVEFSQDSKYLYVTQYASPPDPHRIWQFDLEAGDQDQIRASGVVVAEDMVVYRALQLAPDGKIYVSQYSYLDPWRKMLGIIHEPSAKGPACLYSEIEMEHQPQSGLPNFVQSYFFRPGFTFEKACFDMDVEFSAFNVSISDSVRWDFGDGSQALGLNPVHTYTQDGLYLVSMIAFSRCTVDTVYKTVGVSGPPELGADIDTCATYAATFDAGPWFFAYDWDSGKGNDHFYTTSDTGWHRLTVTDYSGCQALDSVHLGSFPAMNVSADMVHPLCFADSTGSIDLSISGSVLPYSFVWSDGPQTEDRVSLPRGAYTVTITDGINCMLSNTYTVSPPDSLQVHIAPQNYDCVAGHYAMLSAQASGGAVAGSYQYAWSTGEATQAVVFQGYKDYLITVTDDYGCTASDSQRFDAPGPIVAQIGGIPVICHGDTATLLYVQATGGKQPYEILWSDGSQADSLYVKQAGTAGYVLTDANGCKFAAQVAVRQNPRIEIVAEIAHVACKGDSTGSAHVWAGGGEAPYHYIWSSALPDSPVVENLASGQYTVVVTDINQCADSLSIQINEPDYTLEINLLQTPCVCDLIYNGSITGEAAGGIAPYDFFWQTASGDTLAALTGLAPGWYSVWLTDAGGCVLNDSIEVTGDDCVSFLEFPNFFSPNGDDINDVFAASYRNIGEFQATIYNRWGYKVFDWNAVDQGWDGKLRETNREASTGVYFCVAVAKGYDGRDFRFEGYLHLFR